jgi:hypothetical protein
MTKARKMMKKLEIVERLDLAAVEFDILKFPWPLKLESVKTIDCIHKMEYIPAARRIQFMEECWRVLIGADRPEDSGKMTVVVCYYSSTRAIQDPMIEWPPYCEQSFLYFNKGWRAVNQLTEIKCDFDFGYGLNCDPETAGRGADAQPFWVKHYLNTGLDLQVVLTKRR